jgi:signal transduction histidine kinase
VVEAAAGIDPQWLHTARMRLGEGVSGQAVMKRQPVYVPDTHVESDFLFFNPNLRSLLAVPLISRDQALGALTLDSEQPHAFDESVVQLMMIAAAQVSVAIANARLYAESEERAAKLAVAYADLQESDRLKDELVQNVSHELRTPLTFVKGYVDLLLDGTMGIVTTEQHETLQIIADKTKEITRLINDIMSLQRIEANNLIVESFSLDQLIAECIAGHSLTADARGLRFDFNGSDVQAIIWGDRGRINQVLNNLIVNAMKFSPNGGLIRVDLSANGEGFQFVVADEGVGIPADKLDLVFERFYQVDGSSRRRFGGAGLGLAIVKRIVDAHSGRIWVESQVNQGSSFYVLLPAAMQ